MRRKKRNRPEADSSAKQRLSPPESMASEAGNQGHGPAGALLPAAPGLQLSAHLRRRTGYSSL